jgi:RhoGAP domain
VSLWTPSVIFVVKVYKYTTRLKLTLGLHVEGLFRVSPSQSLLQSAIAAYDRGHPVDLRDYGPHIAASLLKQFLSMLPMPMFPAHIYTALNKFPSLPEDEKSQFIQKDILPRLDLCAVILLEAIIGLLSGTPLQPLFSNDRRRSSGIANQNATP